jgi:hypothetical protein
MLKEVQFRLDQEKKAKDDLLKTWEYYKKRGDSITYEAFKEKLLIHFIIKSTEAENSKGGGI